MYVLLKEFKQEHTHAKISLSTFKRYRPKHIVLFSSRKFRQCLCENCENNVLLMNVVNCHVSKSLQAESIDELIKLTLCSRFKRQCIDRSCPNCGVKPFIEKVKSDIGLRDASLSQVVKWSRWERTGLKIKILCSGILFWTKF